jgi:hypothetical protein
MQPSKAALVGAIAAVAQVLASDVHGLAAQGVAAAMTGLLAALPYIKKRVHSGVGCDLRI